MTKVCTQCGETKDLSEFYPTSKGVRPHCRRCSSIIRAQDVLGNLIYRAKARAKVKNVIFNLTREDIVNLNKAQDGKCALTGWVLNWDWEFDGDKKTRPYDRVSLDRIEPTGGYTLDNVQLVCDMVNRAKNVYSQDLFIEMCHLISQGAMNE